MARVTGIGGIFFKSTSDHKALAAWYRDNLGVHLEDWGGSVMRWPDDAREDGGLTVWSLAAADSKWFAPSESNFMINYRVDDLDGLITSLAAAGVEIVGHQQSDDSGKFAWIMDPDGNKVELWEPKARDQAVDG
jgi:predicted enzyme related to lactoylglutathione lyase